MPVAAAGPLRKAAGHDMKGPVCQRNLFWILGPMRALYPDSIAKSLWERGIMHAMDVRISACARVKLQADCAANIELGCQTEELSIPSDLEVYQGKTQLEKEALFLTDTPTKSFCFRHIWKSVSAYVIAAILRHYNHM